MSEITIPKKDLIRQVFRSGGPGGQAQNKKSTGVRLIHKPTGLRAESREERSQSANYKNAMDRLIQALRDLAKESLDKTLLDRYTAKEDASFGNHRRTYRLVGNERTVVDHETGVKHNNAQNVLNGDIDCFLEANLIKGIEQ